MHPIKGHHRDPSIDIHRPNWIRLSEMLFLMFFAAKSRIQGNSSRRHTAALEKSLVFHSAGANPERIIEGDFF